MVKNKIEKRLDSFEERLDRLEKKVFIKKEEKSINENSKNYEGLTGGINFLIDQGYFKKLTPVTDIISELKKENYIYSRQAVDLILRRDFVKKMKILTRVKEEGIWKYVLRK